MIKLDYFARTDVGKIRKENQDSYGIRETRGLFVVCDGMGGGAAGDFASRCAVDIVLDAVESMTARDVSAVMRSAGVNLPDHVVRPMAAVRLANRALHNFSDQYSKLAGMGTTIAAVMFEPARGLLHIYHVGDSRVYRVRSGTIELLTKDHSKVNELVDMGKMREDEIKSAEIQSMITRALGTAPKVKIDYRVEPVRPNDYFILCTDGLNGELEDATIRDLVTINKDSVEQVVDELICAAKNVGGRDNVSVIAIHAGGDPVSRSEWENNEMIGKVMTVPEETAEATESEDRIARHTIHRLALEIPGSARERTFLINPLVLGVMLTVIGIGITVMLTRDRKASHDTEIMQLAGRMTGISLEIRAPARDQIAAYRTTDDTVLKLQMIQDWMKGKDSNTIPVDKVQVHIEGSGKEQFNGLSGILPLKIKLERGNYSVRLVYPGYKIVGERMEFADSCRVTVEPSETYKPVVILIMPQE